MSVASAASVYSWSEPEECMTIGTADELCEYCDENLRTAIDQESQDVTLVKSGQETDKNEQEPSSAISTAMTGSISWYSMPPSETIVEVPKMEGEQLVDINEKLHCRFEVVNSVDIQRQKFASIFPKIEVDQIADVREKLYDRFETVKSVDIKKQKFASVVPKIEAVQIADVREKLYDRFETVKSVDIKKQKFASVVPKIEVDQIADVREKLYDRFETVKSVDIKKQKSACE
ncbi:hypothetical protein NECAME_01348, partial [Necator americanus]